MCIHAEEDLEREKERPGARTKKRERRGRRLTACSNKGESATCTSAAHNALLLVPPRSLARSFCYLSLILCLSSSSSSSSSCFFSSYYSRALFLTLILLSFCRCYTPCRLHPGGTSCCQVCGTDLPPLFFSPLCPPSCPSLRNPRFTHCDEILLRRSPCCTSYHGRIRRKGRGEREMMRTTHIVSRAQTVTCFLWNRLGRTAGIQ